MCNSLLLHLVDHFHGYQIPGSPLSPLVLPHPHGVGHGSPVGIHHVHADLDYGNHDHLHPHLDFANLNLIESKINKFAGMEAFVFSS